MKEEIDIEALSKQFLDLKIKSVSFDWGCPFHIELRNFVSKKYKLNTEPVNHYSSISDRNESFAFMVLLIIFIDMTIAYLTIYLLFNVLVPCFCYAMDKSIFKDAKFIFIFIPVFGLIYTIYLVIKFKV